MVPRDDSVMRERARSQEDGYVIRWSHACFDRQVNQLIPILFSNNFALAEVEHGLLLRARPAGRVVWLTLRYVEIAVLELEPRELVSRGCECGGDFPYL